MLRRASAIAVFCLIVQGCASAPAVIKLAPEHSTGLTGRALVGVAQKPPGFTPFEPAAAAFGAFGGLAMAAAAEKFAQENGIVDPAPLIEERVKASLAQAHGSSIGETLDLMAAKDGTPYPKRDGVLFVDAKTTYWQYVYFPLDWGRFKVQYNALVQLVDGPSSQVLGQYFCVKESHTDSATAPTKDQLLANNSALVNELLQKMAIECATEFETAVLTPET
jgi:hypothetical protein